MRPTIMWVASALAATMSFGCTANVPDETGSTGSSLVRKADYEGQVRYLDEAVSPAPLTAAEMGDTTYAVPVEVRFYHEHAVAWYVSEGIPQIGDPEMAIKAWQIEGHEAISDDVVIEPGGEDGDAAPSGSLTATPPITGTDTGLQTDVGFDHQSVALPFARLDWFEDVVIDWETRPPSYHPGCL